MASSQLVPLRDVRIGEPDANAEYFSSLRVRSIPVFIDCFMAIPNFSMNEFKSGEKYLVYGQKGTGKTSFLRYLSDDAQKNGAICEFIIFKKALLEEVDIQEIGKIPLVLDDEQLQRVKHYQHSIKRLLILMLLSKISNEALSSEEEKDVDAPTRGILSKIANSSITDVIRLSFDSISSIFQSAGVDIEKVTASRAAIDATKLLKRSNDDLLKFLIRRAKRHNSKLRFFLDEIHFAYRSQESLQQDAILVRDTIVAVQNLNDRFSEERIDIILYAAVRSEYLEHPIIASADVNHAIESVGHELTWSTFPVDRSHPLYDLVLMRFSRAVGRNMSRSEFFRTYFANIDPILFLQRTWSKPRDFVRFFKCAKTLYPDKISLRDSEFNAVWRSSAQEAWRELKSAASPFLTPEALALFEQKLATIAPAIFDKSLILNMEKLKAQMMPVYNKAKGKHENFYSFDHFIRLLYILGIFSTKRKEAGQEDIFHSYHRGNRNPHHDGEVMIHPTILKAFG